MDENLRKWDQMEVQTKAEIVNKTENIERMGGKGVEENWLPNRDEQISDTKEETIDTRGTTQTGPTIKTDILNAVAPSIDGKWKALAEKNGLTRHDWICRRISVQWLGASLLGDAAVDWGRGYLPLCKRRITLRSSK